MKLLRPDCAITAVAVATKTNGSTTEYAKGAQKATEQELEDTDSDEGQPHAGEYIFEHPAHDLFPLVLNTR